MQAPPSFSPSAPKSGGSKIWIWILLGVGLCCFLPFLGLVGVGFWGFNVAKGIAGCGFSIDAVSKGMLQYAREHDGKLPNAATWQTDIAPMVDQQMAAIKKKSGPFKVIEANGEWGCFENDVLASGFAFNSDLSGKKLTDIKDSKTVMIFEVSKPGRNQTMPYKPLDLNASPKILGNPRGWYTSDITGRSELIGKNGTRTTISSD